MLKTKAVLKNEFLEKIEEYQEVYPPVGLFNQNDVKNSFAAQLADSVRSVRQHPKCTRCQQFKVYQF
jgi:hypothetical protein